MNWNTMTESLPAQALREVALVLAGPAELEAVNAALEREHYLGAVTPNNREVVQLAVRDHQVLAILGWPRSARKLAARETWIGWDGRTRARRLPLLVQNNRFSSLSKVRQTNLASRVLGLAVAALPEHWQQRTGVRPLLAETFVDPERYAGTCYQAAGWAEVGGTAGFARHGDDYYVAHGAGKRLWLRPLSTPARVYAIRWSQWPGNGRGPSGSCPCRCAAPRVWPRRCAPCPIRLGPRAGNFRCRRCSPARCSAWPAGRAPSATCFAWCKN